MAVYYVPHVVGEPYPSPDADPIGFYGSNYRHFHKRDLHLISKNLGANAVFLRPWRVKNDQQTQAGFLSDMLQAGLCKLIPTFHLAKFYADMIKSTAMDPDGATSSPLAQDFVRFAAALTPKSLRGVELPAWSVDLSLDLKALLPEIATLSATCSEEPSASASFHRYKALLQVLVQWVRGEGASTSSAPHFQQVPFLVPLDTSQVDLSDELTRQRLLQLLTCSSVWLPEVFGPSSPAGRWLLAFAMPFAAVSDFESSLMSLMVKLAALGVRAVIMVGAQALLPDPVQGKPNPIEARSFEATPESQQDALRMAWASYSKVKGLTGNLDGFILDEWADDWDRGNRGPFFLAAESVAEMSRSCGGGRFSHDIAACSRNIGRGNIYPEYFGQVAISSQVLRHCITPRFREAFGFSFKEPSFQGEGGHVATTCDFAQPSFNWILAACVLLSLVVFLQCWSLCCSWCQHEEWAADQPDSRGGRGGEQSVHFTSYIVVFSSEPRFRAGHLIEMRSDRLQSNEEVGRWLWMHVSVQQRLLESQLRGEIAARNALRRRAQHSADMGTNDGSDGSDTQSEDDIGLDDSCADDVAGAMSTIHRRVLEGVAAWCLYVAESACLPATVDRSHLQDLAYSIDENHGRSLGRLFAEALLLRTMESLGEHILSCPERLAYLYYKVLYRKEVLDPQSPVKFTIDFEELQDGLRQMQEHSNPYESAKLSGGSWSRGLNFDDINECGIQCREVTKTFNESVSICVVLDFLICYRVPLMLKTWSVLLSVYIYLGLGDDFLTSFNGAWYSPQWLRLNFIQFSAMADAMTWLLLELLLISRTVLSRWPSLGSRSPGVPDLRWFVEHLVNVAFSLLGLRLVRASADFRRKPWLCRQSDSEECLDQRAASFETLFRTLQPSLFYWLLRLLVFLLMQRKSVPIFIHGTPWLKARKSSGRGTWDKALSDASVNFLWALMLLSCIYFEVTLLLPSMKGLDFNLTCGWTVLADLSGVADRPGVCSEKDQWLSFGCVSCITSIVLAALLTYLTCLVDVYFVFYAFAAVVGSIMGHARHLNDLKNTSLPIDLRPSRGREARLFERTFGPGWQEIWRLMVLSLLAESTINAKHATALITAAGLNFEGDVETRSNSKKERPLDLRMFPSLCADRLAFFFRSLDWIEAPSGPGRGSRFQVTTDGLTSEDFDPGTVPSLSAIIPAYNEVVIPSTEFLQAGGAARDAMNQCEHDRPQGIGEATRPPLGDGVNPNLAFIISQFPDEWSFFAERLHSMNRISEPDEQLLFDSFMDGSLPEALEIEVRLWASMRMQTVARTVVGALRYCRSLASLPKFKEYYASSQAPAPEEHAEVILAHQTFGQRQPEGSPENDESLLLLLSRFPNEALSLVFDLSPSSNDAVRGMVAAFLRSTGRFPEHCFQYASVRCRYAEHGLQVLEVLPRMFPLRLGHGDFKAQGKACNQLNGLRFSAGHLVQALDCNMGAFIGEGYKVPYVLRLFLPLEKKGRATPRCRYLGFREFIFTAREGTVGKCHASAEWTFGTIYQRFLSGMGTRMHYGHPDFLDGFWARNRGGMSKFSPVVNLSEDLFAGYNVRMREESSPHVDFLEFEKGREATFNAASNFFAKIAGGSVAALRSRDNHLLSERTGIMHSLSFYFTSVAFYVSNLIIDTSISLYVDLYIAFTLANIDLGKLTALGSSFSTEWLLSMGIISLLPTLFEMILEYGAMHAVREVAGVLPASTAFFIFQNKNIAAAMRSGTVTGMARYFFTGRPMANQHQTWKDLYITYWKSHYSPALQLMLRYVVYNLLANQSCQGRLPLVLIVISFTAWLITPIVFSPLPRLSLIREDMHDFVGFINGRAGMDAEELSEVVERGRKNTVRTMFECGLSHEIATWTDRPLFVVFNGVVWSLVKLLFLALVLPAVIWDFVSIFVVVLAVQWTLVLGFFSFKLNNLLLTFSLAAWILVLPLGKLVIGFSAANPSLWDRLPEYLISFNVFLHCLGVAKSVFLLLCRLHCEAHIGLREERREEIARRRLHECVRLAYVYFFEHQMHSIHAFIMLLINTLTSLMLAALDAACGAHTWWLLNGRLLRISRTLPAESDSVSD